MLVFVEGGKPGNPEKNPRSRVENQHKFNPLMASAGLHWWEASALTIAPTHVYPSLLKTGSLDNAIREF